MYSKLTVGGCAALLLAAGLRLAAQAPALATYSFEPNDPACQTRTLVSAGGVFPKNPHTLVLRWVGYADYELVYNNQILLFDAYYDRGAGFQPLGVKAGDIKKADAIFIGHGHSDHMSDAASIGARTGAMVVGGPPTTEKLRTQPIDAKQIRNVTGKGGETIQFKGFTVEPVLGRHSENPTPTGDTLNKALASVAISKPLTDAEKAERSEIGKRGTSDPRVRNEGTITYILTFDNGFRLAYKDSSGGVTDFERAAFGRVGRVDVAIVAFEAQLLQTLSINQMLQVTRTYKPHYLLPAHHDAPLDGLWRATEPVFQAVKDDNPNIITISKGYREPICFDTDKEAKR